MNISKTLIEKYHQGLCSPEETRAIEKWLANGDAPEFDFPAGFLKEDIKAEIWKEVHAHAIAAPASPPTLIWKYASIAAAAIVILGVGVSYLMHHSKMLLNTVSTSAVSRAAASNQTEALKIEFGTESGAVYTQENQMLDFCGVIMITPRENMKLSVTSICDGKKETIREINVKAGNSYFAMDLKHQNSSELIVMDKNLVTELPPLVQNSLIAQFGI